MAKTIVKNHVVELWVEPVESKKVATRGEPEVQLNETYQDAAGVSHYGRGNIRIPADLLIETITALAEAGGLDVVITKKS
jgi:hypothetical protein